MNLELTPRNSIVFKYVRMYLRFYTIGSERKNTSLACSADNYFIMQRKGGRGGGGGGGGASPLLPAILN